MNSPKEDAQALVDEFIPFAERMLREFGEFHPFGGHMLLDGEIVHEGATTGEENSPSQDLIEILRAAHSQQGEKKEIRACCVVYDVLISPPGSEEKKDAITFEIDHLDDYSVLIYFPYKLNEGNVERDAPFACKGPNLIFKNGKYKSSSRGH